MAVLGTGLQADHARRGDYSLAWKVGIHKVHRLQALLRARDGMPTSSAATHKGVLQNSHYFVVISGAADSGLGAANVAPHIGVVHRHNHDLLCRHTELAALTPLDLLVVAREWTLSTATKLSCPLGGAAPRLGLQLRELLRHHCWMLHQKGESLSLWDHTVTGYVYVLLFWWHCGELMLDQRTKKLRLVCMCQAARKRSA